MRLFFDTRVLVLVFSLLITWKCGPLSAQQESEIASLPSLQIGEESFIKSPRASLEIFSQEEDFAQVIADTAPADSQSLSEEQQEIVDKLNQQHQQKKRSILPGVDQQAVCPPDKTDAGYTINFNEVNFIEYLHFLSDLTNTNFVYNSDDIDFKVSIIADSPTDLKDVRSSLLQMLRVQGLSLVEEGNNVIISKDPSIQAIGTVVSEEMGNICSANEALLTRVFQLKNMSATKAAAIISAMVSSEALVEASEQTHHLVVTDVSSNIVRISELLRSLDNPDATFEIGTFQVGQSDIQNIVILAEKILRPIAENNVLEIVPQTSSDTIYVVSSPYLVKKSLEVLASLDQGESGGQSLVEEGMVANARFLIYKLQHHKGDQIEKTLQDMGLEFSQEGGSANSHLVAAINSAQWLQATNSLLFVGDAQSLRKIKELLEVLDMPLRQVFIEVLAIRTTINNSLSLGVEYGYRSRTSNRVSTVGSLLTTPSGNTAGQAAKPTLFTDGLDRVTGTAIPVPRTGSQMGFSSGVIGNVLFSGNNLFFDIAALVNALQSDQDTQVMSNPKLVTQDTVPATFYVGSTRPFQTNSILQASGGQSGNFVTASVEYRQLGMTLTVTPYLGNNDTITLEIDQKSSNYVSNATGSGDSGSSGFAIVPVTTDSSIQTRVQIPNKHFLMISGMIEDVKTRSKAALPCLGGLPIVGDLLGTMANSLQKDNLIIFMRPHIIDSVAELDAVTEREDQFYREKNKKGSFIENSAKLYGME